MMWEGKVAIILLGLSVEFGQKKKKIGRLRRTLISLNKLKITNNSQNGNGMAFW
jgi:hypothetical protein